MSYYLKYKNKYINQKKLFGGSSMGFSETAFLDEEVLPKDITDLLDGQTYTIGSFFDLDKDDNYKRKIAYLVNDTAMIPFPLYTSSYSDQVENNDDIYYQCIGVNSELALEIGESNIDIKKPLFKLAGIQTIYVDFNKLQYIKKSRHKFWLLEKETVINKIVSRKQVSRSGSDQLNLDGQVLESEGTTSCITSTYEIYNIKKLFIKKTIELSESQINSLSGFLNYINLSQSATQVYIDDFFRADPSRKFITETETLDILIKDIGLFIRSTMKV
jgi:uncharacterized membrane protein